MKKSFLMAILCGIGTALGGMLVNKADQALSNPVTVKSIKKLFMIKK